MGELMKYSAIATKIRGMESKLLKEEDYRRLASMESVPQAMAWLKRIPAYAAMYGDSDETTLHRGQIEKLLVGTLYYDYSRIYRFCDRDQKDVLDLYFSKFEIAVIKRAFRRVFNHGDRTAEQGQQLWHEIQEYTEIPLDQLAAAGSTGEILEALAGTQYRKSLAKVENMENPTLFDYEMTLDLYYFSMMWKRKDKLLRGKNRDFLTRKLGSQIDLLNMTWIYRAKKYYSLSEASVYSMVIPIAWKLKDGDIRALVTAPDEAALESAIHATSYGKHFRELDGEGLEQIYKQFLRKIYLEERRRNPYSMSVITGYLFEKEEELDKLTTVLEGVRYGLAPEETMKYLQGRDSADARQRR